MKLIDLVHRSIPPAPWAEAENIPWNDPTFSARMLREHLSQANDRASRRMERVETHVRWLHEEILRSEPSRVLDLACGPGLYLTRLAELGHIGLGIDFAPAAVAYARRQAEPFGSRCRYLEADIREANYGEAHDLCTFVHGEFNSYRPADAKAIARRAGAALAAGGRAVFEVHTEAAVERNAKAPPVWYTALGGLFSDGPNLVLRECFWDASAKAGTQRFFIVDPATAAVEQFSSSMQAYTSEQYRALFGAAGFRKVELRSDMGDPEGATADGLFVIVATR